MKKKKSKVKKKKILRFFIFGLTCTAIISFVGMSICKIWVNIYEKYNEKKELNNKLAKLKEEEEILEIDVEKMQDPEYVARYLREKYFYSKSNEYIIRIPK